MPLSSPSICSGRVMSHAAHSHPSSFAALRSFSASLQAMMTLCPRNLLATALPMPEPPPTTSSAGSMPVTNRPFFINLAFLLSARFLSIHYQRRHRRCDGLLRKPYSDDTYSLAFVGSRHRERASSPHAKASANDKAARIAGLLFCKELNRK